MKPMAQKRRRLNRRGVTIVVVLGLISITLALSYAMMRAQGTAIQIQRNSDRLADARQAAVSGLMVALRKMHQSDWQGVDSTLTGQLAAGQSYTVSYTTGDPALTAAHPELADWPYRVTLLSTGYSTGGDGSSSVSMHRVRAVVRLAPRQLGAAPPDWPHMQQHTVYQWTADDFSVELPCRIEGPVWMQGRLELCESYPSFPDARERYLRDLNAMRNNGRPDYRPFNGPVGWRSPQHPHTTALLTTELGVATTNISAKTASDWAPPEEHVEYQLYPGGQTYEIPRLGEVLEGVTLRSDPKTNPLGMFYREGSVELKDDVTIDGTLIAGSDIFVSGRNVRLKPVDLAAVAGSDRPVRLQAACAGDDFRVLPLAGGAVEGVLCVWDEFEVQAGTENVQFDILGRLVTKKFAVRGRWEWFYNHDIWKAAYDAFISQLTQPPNMRKSYFPDFVAVFGRNPKPLITIKPDSSPPTYHFKKRLEPVYVPAAGDAGLRWDLIDWTDSPPGA